MESARPSRAKRIITLLTNARVTVTDATMLDQRINGPSPAIESERSINRARSPGMPFLAFFFRKPRAPLSDFYFAILIITNHKRYLHVICIIYLIIF